jgi:hypothetical protein
VSSAVLARVAIRAELARRSRAHVAYQQRPIEWIVEKLGIPEDTLRWSVHPEYASHAWDGTPDPLVQVADALAQWEDVGVESGTGTGKSFFFACLILWFLACWRGARVFTFAPKEDQLRLYIWAEMAKLWPRFKALFPAAELTDLRIRMDGSDEWGAWGYAVGVRAGEESSTKAQGMHAEHMLLIYEEMPGIPPAVVTAGENTSTAPHNLRAGIGNPDHQGDALHQFCTAPGVRHVRMSSLDHPNVVCDRQIVPGAVSTKAVERRAQRYGKSSRLFQSRVRGISPKEAAESLIRWEWLEAAAQRYDDLALRVGPKALGVDVANSENGDLGAIARGIGACLLEVVTFPCPDANLLGSRVAIEMAAWGVHPRYVGVDSVGVGAGCVNELKRMGSIVQSLNGGERAWPTMDEDFDVDEGERKVTNEERFRNLRAQMHWQLRMDLQAGRVALPNDEELFRDLVAPKWEPKNGVIVVESKEEIREWLKRSPNKGDAVVYWNWVRRRKPEVQEPEARGAFDAEIVRIAADQSRRDAPQKPRARTIHLSHPEWGDVL